MQLPSLCQDGVGRMCLVWRSVVDGYKPPEEDNEEELPKCLLRQYIIPIWKVTKKEQEAVEKQQAKEEHFRCYDAVLDYLESLAHMATAKSIRLMQNDPKKEWDIESMFLKQFRNIGCALKIIGSLDAEIEAISKESIDLSSLVPKLKIVETCSDVLQKEMCKETLLAPVVEKCNAFVTAFGKSLQLLLKGIQHSTLGKVVKFTDKFNPVAKAAEQWQMDGVGWAFEGDGSKADFVSLHACLKSFRAELPHLNAFAAHSSSNSQVKSLVSSVDKLLREGVDMCREACDVAAVVMLSGYFVSNSDLDLDTIKNHCKTLYGFDFEKLTGKLKDLFQKAEIPDAQPKEKKHKEKKEKEVKDKKGKDKDLHKVKKDKKEKKTKTKKWSHVVAAVVALCVVWWISTAGSWKWGHEVAILLLGYPWCDGYLRLEVGSEKMPVYMLVRTCACVQVCFTMFGWIHDW